MENNYYKILGVALNASEVELKEAYRNLAKKYHPDINRSANSLKYFQLVSLAYEVLSDPIKRKKYDLLMKYGVQLKPESEQEPKHPDPRYRPKSGVNSAFQNIRKKKSKKKDKHSRLLAKVLFGSMAFIGLVVLVFAITDIRSDGVEAHERGIRGFVFSFVFLGLLLLGWINKIHEQ